MTPLAAFDPMPFATTPPTRSTPIALCPAEKTETAGLARCARNRPHGPATRSTLAPLLPNATTFHLRIFPDPVARSPLHLPSHPCPLQAAPLSAPSFALFCPFAQLFLPPPLACPPLPFRSAPPRRFCALCASPRFASLSSDGCSMPLPSPRSPSRCFSPPLLGPLAGARKAAGRPRRAKGSDAVEWKPLGCVAQERARRDARSRARLSSFASRLPAPDAFRRPAAAFLRPSPPSPPPASRLVSVLVLPPPSLQVSRFRRGARASFASPPTLQLEGPARCRASARARAPARAPRRLCSACPIACPPKGRQPDRRLLPSRRSPQLCAFASPTPPPAPEARAPAAGSGGRRRLTRDFSWLFATASSRRERLRARVCPPRLRARTSAQRMTDPAAAAPAPRCSSLTFSYGRGALAKKGCDRGRREKEKREDRSGGSARSRVRVARLTEPESGRRVACTASRNKRGPNGRTAWRMGCGPGTRHAALRQGERRGIRRVALRLGGKTQETRSREAQATGVVQGSSDRTRLWRGRAKRRARGRAPEAWE